MDSSLLPEISSDSYPILRWKGLLPQKIHPLQEEASTRRYFLVEYNDGPTSQQLVFCLAETPQEDFKTLTKYFQGKQLPVPKILDSNDSSTQLLQSFEGLNDLSTLKYHEYLNTLPKTLDLILDFQSIPPIEPISSRFFDFEKLFWEVNHTKKGFELYNSFKSKSWTIPPEAFAFLEEVCLYLDRCKTQTICHRDFHSRNLLWNSNNELRVIDYQDARMGSCAYDLSSILYDAYKPIQLADRKKLLNLFRQKAGDRNISLGKKFLETYYTQALQRSFKALGSYLHLASQGKPKFEASILPCLHNLLEICQLGLFPDSLYLFLEEVKDDLTSEN